MSTLRGESPTGRISSRNDWELVYLRHNAFRDSPNPAPGVMEGLEPLVRAAANRSYNKFKSVWGPAGIGADDLQNIGRVHLVTYLHKYRKPTEEENHKIIPIYLRQRFEELAKQTNNKLYCTKTIHHKTEEWDPMDVVPAAVEPADQDYEPGEYKIGSKKILVVDRSGMDLVVRMRRISETGRIGKLLPNYVVECIFRAIRGGKLSITGPLHLAEPEIPDSKVNFRKILQKKLLSMGATERKTILTNLLDDSDPEIVQEAQYWLDNLQANGAKMVKDTPEIKAMVEQIMQEYLAKLPDLLLCPRCGKDKPKDAFGMRVPRISKTDRRPAKAIPQSHCKACRRLAPKGD